MIPVFQTRYAAETFGNCFEACIASILELPLTAIPDRAALVDHDAWADAVHQARLRGGEQAVGDLDLPDGYDDGEDALRLWLQEHGIGWLDLHVGTGRDDVRPGEWLKAVSTVLHHAYWIAHTRQTPSSSSHATVWHGEHCVHDPARKRVVGEPLELGPIHMATLLIAADPPKTARTLDPLPDLSAEIARRAPRIPVDPDLVDRVPSAIPGA